MIGTIKSFSRQHGYGFIISGNNDYFFHVIEWPYKNDPALDETVEFEEQKCRQGLRAVKIRRF